MRKTFRPPAATRFVAASCASLLSMLALTACEGGTPTAQDNSRDQAQQTSAPSEQDPPLALPLDMPPAGSWRGSLLSPGGPLTFGLELVEEADGLRAVILNGTERRPAGLVTNTPTGAAARTPPSPRGPRPPPVPASGAAGTCRRSAREPAPGALVAMVLARGNGLGLRAGRACQLLHTVCRHASAACRLALMNTSRTTPGRLAQRACTSAARCVSICACRSSCATREGGESAAT